MPYQMLLKQTFRGVNHAVSPAPADLSLCMVDMSGTEMGSEVGWLVQETVQLS